MVEKRAISMLEKPVVCSVFLMCLFYCFFKPKIL